MTQLGGNFRVGSMAICMHRCVVDIGQSINNAGSHSLVGSTVNNMHPSQRPLSTTVTNALASFLFPGTKRNFIPVGRRPLHRSLASCTFV